MHVCDGRPDWFLKIKQEIKDQKEKGRPVLVFFDHQTTLEEFYNKTKAKEHGVLLLYERTQEENRESTVSRALVKGQVTFSTRDFGRGTDFMCRDADINKNGGVHVIQTFVSEEISEEKQIQGFFFCLLSQYVYFHI